MTDWGGMVHACDLWHFLLGFVAAPGIHSVILTIQFFLYRKNFICEENVLIFLPLESLQKSSTVWLISLTLEVNAWLTQHLYVLSFRLLCKIGFMLRLDTFISTAICFRLRSGFHLTRSWTVWVTFGRCTECGRHPLCLSTMSLILFQQVSEEERFYSEIVHICLFFFRVLFTPSSRVWRTTDWRNLKLG